MGGGEALITSKSNKLFEGYQCFLWLNLPSIYYFFIYLFIYFAPPLCSLLFGKNFDDKNFQNFRRMPKP